MKKVLILNLIILLVFGFFLGCTATEPSETDDEQDQVNMEDQDLPETDEATTPSIVTDDNSLVTTMGSDGTWIVIFQEDLTTDKELVLEGEFMNDGVIARKLALYAQDAERNKTASYTLTAPKLTIRSENTRLQGGTFVGDIYVEANGFTIKDATVEGNIYFSSENFKSTFDTTEGTVTGNTEVQ
ncbi:MAG: hypothetical protein ACOWWH_01490 [Eubacteriaceae bacterium]